MKRNISAIEEHSGAADCEHDSMRSTSGRIVIDLSKRQDSLQEVRKILAEKYQREIGSSNVMETKAMQASDVVVVSENDTVLRSPTTLLSRLSPISKRLSAAPIDLTRAEVDTEPEMPHLEEKLKPERLRSKRLSETERLQQGFNHRKYSVDSRNTRESDSLYALELRRRLSTENDAQKSLGFVNSLNFCLTVGDLKSLIGTNWLTDEVINSYISIVVGKYSSEAAYLSSYWSDKLSSGGPTAVQKWQQTRDLLRRYNSGFEFLSCNPPELRMTA